MTRINDAAADLLDMAFALCGLRAPAKFRVGASDVQVMAQGHWLDYTLRRGQCESPSSQREHIPCTGELAGQWTRFVHAVEVAVQLAQSSSHAADLLVPGLRNLEQAAHWFPAQGSPLVARIQRRLRECLMRFEPGTPRFEKLDVRNQYTFTLPTMDAAGRESRTARGWLGIPSRIRKHDRDSKAHRAINKDFPDDHAGHLIARDFGAPADARNLDPQNAVMNSWGTYRDLEHDWANLLELGYGIEVEIEVVGRPGKTNNTAPQRPDRRRARWTLIAPNGTRTEHEKSLGDRPIPKEKWKFLLEIKEELQKNPPQRQEFIPRIVRP